MLSRIQDWTAFGSIFFLPKEEGDNNPSGELELILLEEKFFFLYNYHTDLYQPFSLPIHERKWLIQRFLQQKRREQEAIESARKRS